MASTSRLATRWAFGRRTMRIPERRQNRAVSSRRGLTQPRGPASTRMAGSSVTAARNATPTPIAARHTDRGEHSHLGEADPEEGDAHRGGGCGDHLSDRDHRLLHRVVEIRPLSQIVVIAADEKDRIIRSRAGDHGAEEDDGLVRDAQPEELGDSCHQGLRGHQGRPDRRQRQQHGDRVAVHHQQNEQHQDGDRELDRQAVLFARDGEIGDGGRGSGDVHGQWAVAATLCLTTSATRLKDS